MASQEFTTSNANIRFSITSIENSYSVSGNTSSVTAYVDIWRTNTGYTTYGTGSITLTINGTAYSASITPSMTITSTSRRFISQTVTVGHNADGSKAITVSASFSMDTPLNGSGSISHTLTTIPRASTPTLSPSSQAIGSAITINTNRASSGFTHTLTYAFGAASGTIASSVGSSASWTLPTSLANQIPNATSGTGTITCKTYSGSTLIGTKSVSFTATVPSSSAYQPTITSISYAEATSGIADKFGAFVQSHSTLVLSMSASGVYGSTIKAYEIKANGQTFAASSGTTNPIVESGAITISYKATDTRSRFVTQESELSVLAYLPPSALINVKRANASGAEDDQGEYALCIINAAITPLNDLNDKSFVIRYKRTSEENWTTVDVTPASGYELIDYTRLISGISTDNGYEFELVAQDYFGSSVGQSVLSTAFTIYDVHSTGRGFAFGKVSEIQNTLEISDEWEVKTGDIQAADLSASSVTINSVPLDYIVEQGTSGIWTWRKWNGGIAECWGKKTVTITFTTSANWGVMFSSSDNSVPGENYPLSLFVEEPMCSASLKVASGGNCWLASSVSGTDNQIAKTPSYQVVRPTASALSTPVTMSYHAKGRWK